jgi:hypothetical protein
MNSEFSQRDWKVLEKKLFRIALLVLVGIIVGSFVPIVGLVVFIPVFRIGLLWFYSGLVAVCLTFSISMLAAKSRGQKLVSSLVSGIRWSVIVFMFLGVLLAFSVIIIPGYMTFTVGYWIHCKLWVDAAQIRNWAAHQEGSNNDQYGMFQYENIPYEQWPSSLRTGAILSQGIYIDPQTKAVTLVDGGALAGHWGLYVAAPGATPKQDRNYYISFGDGAWVWHSLE